LEVPNRRGGLPSRCPFTDRTCQLTIDGGWREVADTALAFVRKHGPKVEAA
jgi:hypothetical protein